MIDLVPLPVKANARFPQRFDRRDTVPFQILPRHNCHIPSSGPPRPPHNFASRLVELAWWRKPIRKPKLINRCTHALSAGGGGSKKSHATEGHIPETRTRECVTAVTCSSPEEPGRGRPPLARTASWAVDLVNGGSPGTD